MTKITFERYDAIRGCTVLTVEDEQGNILGWIHRTGNSHYRHPIKGLYSDTTRYTSEEAALAAFG